MKTLRRAPADSEIVPMTATAARTAGDPVVVAGGVGIQVDTVANGAIGAVMVGGQHLVNKLPAQAWTEGAKIYLDISGTVEFTTVSAGNTLAGFATKAAANPSSQGEVHLNPPPGV